MTLYTSDYLEYYLTLVGWIIHNGIWDVLVASGIFAVPFLAIVVQEWLKARAEGADIINFGRGNPDLPTPPHQISSLFELPKFLDNGLGS